MADYLTSSPYVNTLQSNGVLQILNYRAFSIERDDLLYKIDAIYDRRPDLLAFDQYNDPSLWWVFMHRNPDVIKDPIWDFQAGILIRIPKLETLRSELGL